MITVNPSSQENGLSGAPDTWVAVRIFYTLAPYIPMQIRSQFLTPYWLLAFTIPNFIGSR